LTKLSIVPPLGSPLRANAPWSGPTTRQMLVKSPGWGWAGLDRGGSRIWWRGGSENCPPKASPSKESEACFTPPPTPETYLGSRKRNFQRFEGWLLVVWYLWNHLCFEQFKEGLRLGIFTAFTIMLTLLMTYLLGVRTTINLLFFGHNSDGLQIKHWLMWEKWFFPGLSCALGGRNLYERLHNSLMSWLTKRLTEAGLLV